VNCAIGTYKKSSQDGHDKLQGQRTAGRESAMRGVEGNIVDGKDKRLIFRRGRRVAAVAFKGKVIPVQRSESAKE